MFDSGLSLKIQMQLTILTVPFFAALAVAMPPPTLDWLDAKVPDCGRGCLNKGYKAVGCDIKDYQCRCDRGRQLLNTAPYTTLHCIEANCNSKEHDRMYLIDSTPLFPNPRGTSPYLMSLLTLYNYLDRAKRGV